MVVREIQTHAISGMKKISNFDYLTKFMIFPCFIKIYSYFKIKVNINIFLLKNI